MRHATESRGFTLIEMIVAMVIGGLLLAMVGMFGRHQIDAYVEVSARMQLADAADTALGRMEREIRAPCPTASGFPAITWNSCPSWMRAATGPSPEAGRISPWISALAPPQTVSMCWVPRSG